MTGLLYRGESWKYHTVNTSIPFIMLLFDIKLPFSGVKYFSKNTLKYNLGSSVLLLFIFWLLLLDYIPKVNHVLLTPYIFPDTQK